MFVQSGCFSQNIDLCQKQTDKYQAIASNTLAQHRARKNLSKIHMYLHLCFLADGRTSEGLVNGRLSADMAGERSAD